MRLLPTSAALLALAGAASAQAQSVGLGASGQVNSPTVAPAKVPSNIGPPIDGFAQLLLVPDKPVPGGVINGMTKLIIKDGRTRSTG